MSEQPTNAGAMVPVDDMPISWKTLHLIARTEMVPKSLRGRPEAMLGAILAGRELGLPPMEAMRAIDVIDGRPSLSGELMLRLIREKGHKVKFTTMTSEKVVAVGLRGDDDDDQMTVEFTIEDAKRAGLAGKDNWKKYPSMMMAWRCVTMLGRFHFPDVIGAVKVSYTPDELGSATWMPTDEEADAVLELAEPAITTLDEDPDNEVIEAEIVEDDDDQEPVTPHESSGDEAEPVLPTTTPEQEESLVSVESEQWSKLNVLLGLPDPTQGTRDDIERRTRKLYALMKAVDLWPDGEDGVDQLHQDLMVHYGADHWGSLEVKANMQAFAAMAWDIAKETVMAHRDTIEHPDPFEGLT